MLKYSKKLKFKGQEISYKVCNSDRDWMSPERDPDNPKLESLLQKQPPWNNNNSVIDELFIYKMDNLKETTVCDLC